MKKTPVLRLVDRYESCLKRHFPTATAARKSTRYPLGAQIDHLLWMLQEAKVFVTDSNDEVKQATRAYRWLGFVEGSLVQLGIITQGEIQMLDVEAQLPDGPIDNGSVGWMLPR